MTDYRIDLHGDYSFDAECLLQSVHSQQIDCTTLHSPVECDLHKE